MQLQKYFEFIVIVPTKKKIVVHPVSRIENVSSCFWRVHVNICRLGNMYSDIFKNLIRQTVRISWKPAWFHWFEHIYSSYWHQFSRFYYPLSIESSSFYFCHSTWSTSRRFRFFFSVTESESQPGYREYLPCSSNTRFTGSLDCVYFNIPSRSPGYRCVSVHLYLRIGLATCVCFEAMPEAEFHVELNGANISLSIIPLSSLRTIL